MESTVLYYLSAAFGATNSIFSKNIGQATVAENTIT